MSGMTLHDENSVTPKSLRGLHRTNFFESVGDNFSRSFLPIIAVSYLGASAQVVGLINSIGLIAFLFLSLPIGLWADRTAQPQRLMLMGTISRALLTLIGVFSFIQGFLVGSYGIFVLIFLALGIGTADVIFSTGQSLLIPRLVKKDDIRLLYGKVQSISQTGGTLGPIVLSGALMIFTAPFAWIISTTLYSISALAQRNITNPAKNEIPIRVRKSAIQHLEEGAHELFVHRPLALVTISNALTNAGIMAANTLVPIIAIKHFQITPTHFAFAGVFGALFGTAGATCASALTQKLGLKALRLVMGILLAAGVAYLLFIIQTQLQQFGFTVICIQYALNGFCTATLLVSGSDLAPQLVSTEILGTVMGASRTIIIGVMPISAIAVGTVTDVGGLLVATWIWSALLALAVIPNIFLRKIRD